MGNVSHGGKPFLLERAKGDKEIGGLYTTVWRKYQIHVQIQGPENPINGQGSPIGTTTRTPARDGQDQSMQVMSKELQGCATK